MDHNAHPMSANTDPWIAAGYSAFAQEGPAGIRVEQLARAIGKSKSSFYHHFADPEIFTDRLLEHHLQRSTHIAQRLLQCAHMDPDVLHLFLDVKEDILFQRQLRIHRNKPAFQRCIERAHAPVEAALLAPWTHALGLSAQPALAQAMLTLVVDNFYLRATPDTFHLEGLRAYLTEIQRMVGGMPGTT